LGNATYNIFGWQNRAICLQDGYASTFAELMEATRWERYGSESGNPKCANCMVHSGYEASAVDDTFDRSRLLSTVRATLFGGGYAMPQRLTPLEKRSAPPASWDWCSLSVSRPQAAPAESAKV